jgi:hypothetical protein
MVMAVGRHEVFFGGQGRRLKHTVRCVVIDGESAGYKDGTTNFSDELALEISMFGPYRIAAEVIVMDWIN